MDGGDGSSHPRHLADLSKGLPGDRKGAGEVYSLVVGGSPGEHLPGLCACDGGADLIDAGLWCHGSLGCWGGSGEDDLRGREIKGHSAFLLGRRGRQRRSKGGQGKVQDG